MAAICFSDAHTAAMIAHAHQAAPHEACGLVLGKGNRVESVIPVQNIAAEPTTRYEIDPAEIVKYHAQIIGFYHSHPQHDPLPSVTDIRDAWTGGAVYVIIGLKSVVPKISAWTFYSSEVQAVDVLINTCVDAHDDPSLSNFQQSALIITAMIALLFLLIVSIELLPPAPPIP